MSTLIIISGAVEFSKLVFNSLKMCDNKWSDEKRNKMQEKFEDLKKIDSHHD